MKPLELVKLVALIELTPGVPDIRIGLIDGPVFVEQPGPALSRIGSLYRMRASGYSIVGTAPVCIRPQ